MSYLAADKNGNTQVKHYLIKPDDIHGAKKTLPDFLRDYRDFLCILQLLTEKGTENRILQRCIKDTVLADYYSKLQKTPKNGYEEDIEVTPQQPLF